MSTTYKVVQKDENGNAIAGFRAVEAKSKAAVLNHIAGPYFDITAFTKADYQAALKSGVEIEVVAEPEPAKPAGADPVAAAGAGQAAAAAAGGGQ